MPPRSMRLAQFVAEKLDGYQHCNDGGTDHGGSADLFAGQAEVIMGNVCKRECDGGGHAHYHHETQNSVDRLFHSTNMRPRLIRSKLNRQACLPNSSARASMAAYQIPELILTLPQSFGNGRHSISSALAPRSARVPT